MEIFLNLVRENIYTADVRATFRSLLLFTADHHKKDMEIIFLLKYLVYYSRSSSLNTTDSRKSSIFFAILKNAENCPFLLSSELKLLGLIF